MTTLTEPKRETTLPFGRLDPTKDWCQPVGQPLYPPLPWHSRDGEHTVAIYETDMDAVLDFLPRDLQPAFDPPRVIAWLGHYSFCSGGGPYSECSPLVPVLYEGRTYNYPLVVYLGNDGCEEWFAAGREVWGHAKKQGNIYIEKTEGRGLVRGWCERPRGQKLIDITIGPFDRVGDPKEFDFIPVISVRTIPHPERAEPETCQLVETSFDVNVALGSDGVPKMWAGQATVELHRSEQDPWYRLPVRNVLAGYYVSFNMVTGFGKILKSYV